MVDKVERIVEGMWVREDVLRPDGHVPQIRAVVCYSSRLSQAHIKHTQEQQNAQQARRDLVFVSP